MQIKTDMDKLIVESFYHKNDKEIYFHPSVISDCIKSLIGLDLENPNKSILDWFENNLSLSDKTKFKDKKHISFEMVSYSSLQQAFFDCNKKRVEEIIKRISIVSDGSQLIEFFIEMSLFQTGRSFISIWRIHRIMKFCEMKDNLICYNLMSGFLLDDNFRENCFKVSKKINFYNLKKISRTYKSIVLYCHIADIAPNQFIRSKKIQDAYFGMLNYIKETASNESDYIGVERDKIEKDRKEIVVKLQNKNSSNILLIDSVRMLIKKDPFISKNFIDLLLMELK